MFLSNYFNPPGEVRFTKDEENFVRTQQFPISTYVNWIISSGDGSFTTIGFQTNGKTLKFTTTHKRPGRETADVNDPYGEKGFYSIKWYYGFMALRPERLGILWTKSS